MHWLDLLSIYVDTCTLTYQKQTFSSLAGCVEVSNSVRLVRGPHKRTCLLKNIFGDLEKREKKSIRLSIRFAPFNGRIWETKK